MVELLLMKTAKKKNRISTEILLLFQALSMLLSRFRQSGCVKCHLDYVHTVTFSSVFKDNAFSKVSFSWQVYTGTDTNALNWGKRFRLRKRCLKLVFPVWNVSDIIRFRSFCRVNKRKQSKHRISGNATEKYGGSQRSCFIIFIYR